ncbi:baseplate hub subunit [Synechococcus phage ACG-2014b]|jgi:hypothetical protein|uniref:Baseplate hub subunit n=2 Tax=Synechococcus phage ACG-2014b TaxID=1493508 RepID=A0A0E3FYH7_9CAUD|nr:baseplate hub [Synechococcus phage ACG-2014b]YP_009779636.1 baseplate hub [Synechococcus phage ACG-2014b]YP_009779850.1 baseplate hub [Synechococcus phage ACG-2014b]AIX17230.1 baseplate hub subunit [Synechococcus phage ACG-2014b]AIX17444.1 baseplate hub subunit [Synechococcus phage ACG-2014b]AIX17659.1 baseplate hub subunit [Synechococcus phage ACG-2014b]AIX17876.1 baseplate hub subunit [Synechococcus phage ACG-2014b]AIX18091.1 baseplate hub subunit [Synechococcus phage ACG-2014b]
MPLPKLNVPSYKTTLPSTGTKVTYRPFLVKEEKLLLIATETGDSEDMVQAIKTIITDCTDIKDVSSLATFDIEFLFLKIRTSSVGENVNVTVTCSDDGETEVDVTIPLDDIKIHKTRGHKSDIKLSEDVAISMGYPSIETFVKMNFDDGTNQVDQVFEMASTCIKTISDSNQVYDCKDFPKAELLEFFDQLSSKQFGLIQNFFETMPKLSHTIKVNNPNTGVENEIVLEGLASFFA